MSEKTDHGVRSQARALPALMLPLRLRLGAFGIVASLLAFAGCAAVLGIPSDVDPAPVDTPVGEAGPDTAPSLDGGTDALMGADAAADAEPDALFEPACDLTKDFLAPTILGSVSTTGQEGSPRLSEDELTIYFDALRPGDTYFELYTAKRTLLTDSFVPATKVAGDPNTPDNHEFAPNISIDGKSLFFERQVPTGDDNFYVATRADTASPFGIASPISGVNTPLYEGKLNVRGDGSELYFVTRSGASPKLAIHVAKRVAGNYVTTRLANVNGSTDEFSPVISKNGLVLYFASTRSTTPGGTNDSNIWVATRAKTTDDFGFPTQLLGGVNSPMGDEPGWISADGCRLYLYSNRAGGMGMQDIYVAKRPK